MLETGEPPDGGTGVYTCNATVLTSSGPAYFSITDQNQHAPPAGSGSSNESWTVTSAQSFPASSAQAANWVTMPATFASGHRPPRAGPWNPNTRPTLDIGPTFRLGGQVKALLPEPCRLSLPAVVQEADNAFRDTHDKVLTCLDFAGLAAPFRVPIVEGIR